MHEMINKKLYRVIIQNGWLATWAACRRRSSGLQNRLKFENRTSNRETLESRLSFVWVCCGELGVLNEKQTLGLDSGERLACSLDVSSRSTNGLRIQTVRTMNRKFW